MPPYTFIHDRPDDDLAIAFVLDRPSGKYCAFYTDLPGLIVQADDKDQAREMLEELFVLYIKSICKIK